MISIEITVTDYIRKPAKGTMKNKDFDQRIGSKARPEPCRL